jgi:hypothetical protein
MPDLPLSARASLLSHSGRIQEKRDFRVKPKILFLLRWCSCRASAAADEIADRLKIRLKQQGWID